MTIQQCYEKLGGDYDQMARRIPSARLIQKFVVKFLEDASYAELCDSMKAGCRAEAFRAAHTLKGVCGNLSFTRLLSSTSQLTELLRPETQTISEDARLALPEVEKDYALTVGVIREYLATTE